MAPPALKLVRILRLLRDTTPKPSTMSQSKLKPTSFDYAMAALAPILIISMIGSLVFFLVNTLYQGDFLARLLWILGLFTTATVLITRIAIEQSRSQSIVYLVLLAGATLLVAPRFFVLEGSLAPFSVPILVGFLALIIYLADRITMDCTAVDEGGDSNGEGLLQSLGILHSTQKKRSNSAPSAPLKSRRQRKHNPGVWVLYFSLLALPIFGLGQLMISSPISRRFAFACTVVFLLSAMALLVVISLLSLRQYVRQRDIEMDAPLAIQWLIAGIAAVSILVGGMAIVPLPLLGSSNLQLPFRITSRTDLQSNQQGWGQEGVGTNASQPAQDAHPKAPAQGGQVPDRNSPQGQGGNGVAKNANTAQPNPRDSADPTNSPSNGSGSNRSDDRKANGNASDQASSSSGQPSSTSNSGSAGPGSSNTQPQNSQSPNGNSSSTDSNTNPPNSNPSNSPSSNPSPSSSDSSKPNASPSSGTSKNDSSQASNDSSSSRDNPSSQPRPPNSDPSSNQPASTDNSNPSGDSQTNADSKEQNPAPSKDAGAEQRPNPAAAPAGNKDQAKSDRPQQNDAKASAAQDRKEPPKPDAAQPKSPPPNRSYSLEWDLGSSLRWLMIMALLLATLIFGLWYRRQILHAIREWISQWAAWFRGDEPDSEMEQRMDDRPSMPIPPDFASLSNPFAAGLSDPNKIIQQLFQASVVWGREHRVPRREDETPEEYLLRLGKKYREIADPLTQLGRIYSRLAYAQKRARNEEAASLRPLWDWFVAHGAPAVTA
jgi:hypothetical protein